MGSAAFTKVLTATGYLLPDGRPAPVAGNVSAFANTTINGSGRNVIAGANAVGNTATFYVTRTGGN